MATGPVGWPTSPSANDDTGTYSAAVNRGDGGAVAPATVAFSGTTGTGSCASHTFARAGTVTVTTLVANAEGATDVVSKSVTVSGPTITKFSGRRSCREDAHDRDLGLRLHIGLQGDHLQLGHQGGVGHAGQGHQDGSGYLDTELSASKTAKLGSFNLTLSEAGGANTTFKNAIKVAPKTVAHVDLIVLPSWVLSTPTTNESGEQISREGPGNHLVTLLAWHRQGRSGNGQRSMRGSRQQSHYRFSMKGW